MIFNEEGVPLLNIQSSAKSDSVRELSIYVDCFNGYYLSSASLSGVLVEAKHKDSVSYSDISVSPIDLSSWNSTRQKFNIKISIGTFSVRTFKEVNLKVSKNF